MTIFVDDAMIEATVRVHTSKWCHLFTDSDDQTELHEFAAKIGLKRSWFQGEEYLENAPWLCHYDLTEGKRRQAVAKGAVEISWRETGQMASARAEAKRAERDRQEEVERKIEAWHDAPEGSDAAKQKVYEYLGWTWEEYKAWGERGEIPERDR